MMASAHPVKEDVLHEVASEIERKQEHQDHCVYCARLNNDCGSSHDGTIPDVDRRCSSSAVDIPDTTSKKGCVGRNQVTGQDRIGQRDSHEHVKFVKRVSEKNDVIHF